MSDTTSDAKLPLSDTGKASPDAPQRGTSGQSRLYLIPLAMLLLFTGAVVGMYFQPPTLRAFFGFTGLEPGGGTDTPIATAISHQVTEQDIAELEAGAVVALGRLIPKGDVVTLSVPYGAEGARIETLSVAQGQWVEAGDILATLDNRSDLEAAIQVAEVEVSVAQGLLTQTQLSLSASRAEARAALKRAEAEARLAAQELKRTQSLKARGVSSQSALDRALAADRQIRQEVQRLSATLARYGENAQLAQAEIAIVEHRLQAAKVTLANAKIKLEKSVVRAPMAGRVLELHARPGERPSSQGILDFGNTQQMTAEVEVYQNQIRRIQHGALVRLKSEALPNALSGRVIAIGLEVGRQSVIDVDPAANTDARVITVTVTLDASSSELAGHFVNLEVLAWFDSGDTE